MRHLHSSALASTHLSKSCRELAFSRWCYEFDKTQKRPARNLKRLPCESQALLFIYSLLGWLLTSIYNLFTAHKPTTTLPGLIISLVSIAVMWALSWANAGSEEHSSASPILADANCTMVCIYMSIVLLASSLIYQLTGFGFIDSIGAFGLIYFSYSEGKESFEKAADLEDENAEKSN